LATLPIVIVDAASNVHDAGLPTMSEDTILTFDPRANDSTGPANESDQTLTITAVTQGAHGAVEIVGGQVKYTPAAMMT